MASLVIAYTACTSLICTSFNDLACVDPKYLNWPTSYSTNLLIHTSVDSLGFMMLTTILLELQLFLQSFGELLEFFILASKKIEIISES